MEKRKRRPGGGRKPQGEIAGKDQAFATRIQHTTRIELEAAAKEAGVSLSQFAERMLCLGLKTTSAGNVTDPSSAIGYLIGGIAMHGWNDDPTLFATFRLAVDKLLDQLRPPGKIDTRAAGVLFGSTPEVEASRIVAQVRAELSKAQPRSFAELESSLRRPTAIMTAELQVDQARMLATKEFLKFHQTNKMENDQ